MAQTIATAAAAQISTLTEPQAARKPGDPHPFVSGQDGTRRFLTMVGECARAYGAQMIDPPPLIPPNKDTP